MAMSGREYSAVFSGVAITAAQDLFNIGAGATKIVAIQQITLGQITQATVGNLRLRGRYLPSTVTNGSGGTAPTPRPLVPGDAAATATARVNDTTQATSSGTAVDLFSDQWSLLNGYLWVPANTNRPLIVGLGGAFILSLDSAPAASITVSGTIVFEELP